MTELVSGTRVKAVGGTVMLVLGAISACHFINDTLQALLVAVYPMLKSSLGLSFSQIGLITLTYQITASVLQPLIGLAADRRPRPMNLTIGMGSTLCGMLLLATAHVFALVLAAAILIGFGSAVFHPESSRVARMASGGRPGFAQSVFQVGGNVGQAVGPLLAAFLVYPYGQGGIAWCALLALIAMMVLRQVGHWAMHQGQVPRKMRMSPDSGAAAAGQKPPVARAMGILVVLVFAKFFYLASLTSYYIFYLVSQFHISVRAAQIDLFIFAGAVALGTLIGGPIGDRIGRRRVIWFSILGILPFTLILPHVDLFWTCVLTVPIGVILASAFPAIVVYAQELVPEKIGTISGLFFGVAFGMGGIGAAALGVLADHTSIGVVYQVCAYLPLIGLFAVFLPEIETGRQRTSR